MSDDRNSYYASALLTVVKAEGATGQVPDELFRFARALEGSDELREALIDPHIPASRRQQIVEDLLGGTASPVTTSLVSMVVGAGRARDLPAIIDALVAMSAAEATKEVAEVRSTVELTADQQARLAAALKQALGVDVEVKVIIDPSVLGGLVTQVGDTVIDGSVRHRLAEMREAF